jgi:threonine dehydrogenase-like Zn-dependent dehydrogenase
MGNDVTRSSPSRTAQALWCVERQRYALAEEAVPEPGPDEVLVEAIASAVSRGTERLVFEGRVPDSEMDRMRCPHQAGSFHFPVKYGYALVGRVVAGMTAHTGRTVFALHPHQSCALLPQGAVTLVPDSVPPVRATLAANMETALNVVWDSGVSAGDRVLVVGAGVVGLLVARLLAQMPGTAVTVTDLDEGRAVVVEALGARFAPAAELPQEMDVAINASGSDAGLRRAVAAAGLEARVVEASWLGAGHQTLELGGAFHSRRLSIVSSQVGCIPAARAPRWNHARRLATALALLADPVLDRLITDEVPFAEAPRRLPRLLASDALGIVIRYG